MKTFYLSRGSILHRDTLRPTLYSQRSTRHALFRFSISPILRLSLSLCILVSLSPAALYVFTDTGWLARSTDNGTSWAWVDTPLPSSESIDMTTSPNHDLRVISKTGEVHRSVNYGSSWDSRGNIPVSDACAVWAITGLTFVVTESGDFYQRDASGTWSLLGNVGASDCVDLVPHPTNGFLVFTRSGDVWLITTEPFTKSLIGNVNSSRVAGAVTLSSSVLAVTDEGDVARSMDNGAHWSWQGTVSQLTITGITSKGTVLYLTTDAGEIMRSTDQGSNWSWCGNVSQVGIMGITSDSVSVIGVEEDSIHVLEIFGVYPNPSRGRFTVCFRADFTESGTMRLFDVLGREVGSLWHGTIMHGMNTVGVVNKIRGVHFLVIESSKASAVKKIIVD